MSDRSRYERAVGISNEVYIGGCFTYDCWMSGRGQGKRAICIRVERHATVC